MYRKVIILEVKEQYALAMDEGGEVIRIRNRDGLNMGDRVYVLPEDLYVVEAVRVEKTGKNSGNKGKEGRSGSGSSRRNSWARIAGMAAVLILCITLLFPQIPDTTVFAQVSFDGDSSIQLALDPDSKILHASSPDQSVDADALTALEGRTLSDVTGDLMRLCGTGSLMIGYVPLEDAQSSASMISEIQKLFGTQSTVILIGRPEDLSLAAKNSKSLGRFLMDRYDAGEVLKTLQQKMQELPTWMIDQADENPVREEAMSSIANRNSREEVLSASGAGKNGFTEESGSPVYGAEDDDEDDGAEADDDYDYDDDREDDEDDDDWEDDDDDRDDVPPVRPQTQSSGSSASRPVTQSKPQMQTGTSSQKPSSGNGSTGSAVTGSSGSSSASSGSGTVSRPVYHDDDDDDDDWDDDDDDD